MLYKMQQFKYFKAMVDFYSSNKYSNKDLQLIIHVYMISAEYAKEHDFIPHHVEALVELANIFSLIGMKNRAGATLVSTIYVKQCNSMESCREILRREPQRKLNEKTS